MKARGSSFTWAAFTAVTVTLALSVVPAQAQTPGRVPMFDPLGTTGACNSAVAIDCVDSVITQDASGNIGIGTTTPADRLHVVTNNDVYPAGLTLEGTATTFNGVGVALLNRADGNTNPWVLGTGGALGPHFFSIGDSFAYRLVIDDRTGNVGIGRTDLGAKLHASAEDTAVRGDSTSGMGVVGNSRDQIGVFGSSRDQIGVFGTSTNYVGVIGRAGAPIHPGVWARSVGELPANLGLRVDGRFEATGTKNAVVALRDGQHVLLTAEESTEVWFSDYGTAQLVNGRATVQIDLTYLQTVNTEKDYHVFLTARGSAKGSLYIENETPSSFEIREPTGTANIKVSYRIVAKRKDFADERLKKADAPLAYREPTTKTVVAGTASGGIATERH